MTGPLHHPCRDRGKLQRMIVYATAFVAAFAFAGDAVWAEPTRHADRAEAGEQQHLSLADTRFAWPTWDDVVRVLLMQDYNTRVVLAGTTLLGICAGIVGTFMLLRKRALVGDVVAHASLPGIAVAFITLELIEPESGRSLNALLIGALLAGCAGVVFTGVIRRYTRIKEDAALAIVLSIFFGIGVALLTIVQKLPTGSKAGLHQFVYGMTAATTAEDVMLIAGVAAVVLIICLFIFKEFSLLCFDEEFAASQGWPVVKLDALLMALVVIVTVIGLQSVGLLLVVALLIIPAAAARFWTDRLGWMTLTSAGLGGLSALLGVLASALFPRLAAGPVIVLFGSAFFLLSMFFGAQRGVIRRILIHRRLRQRVGRHDLLRALFECLEPLDAMADGSNIEEMTQEVVSLERLQAMRSWSPSRLQRLLSVAIRKKLVRADSTSGYRLTPVGSSEARQVVRNHRLWETYLITHADIAPSHVDRDADQIEHILEPEVIAELNAIMSERYPQMTMPPSPHPLDQEATTAQG